MHKKNRPRSSGSWPAAMKEIVQFILDMLQTTILCASFCHVFVDNLQYIVYISSYVIVWFIIYSPFAYIAIPILFNYLIPYLLYHATSVLKLFAYQRCTFAVVVVLTLTITVAIFAMKSIISHSLFSLSLTNYIIFPIFNAFNNGI